MEGISSHLRWRLRPCIYVNVGSNITHEEYNKFFECFDDFRVIKLNQRESFRAMMQDSDGVPLLKYPPFIYQYVIHSFESPSIWFYNFTDIPLYIANIGECSHIELKNPQWAIPYFRKVKTKALSIGDKDLFLSKCKTKFQRVISWTEQQYEKHYRKSKAGWFSSLSLTDIVSKKAYADSKMMESKYEEAKRLYSELYQETSINELKQQLLYLSSCCDIITGVVTSTTLQMLDASNANDLLLSLVQQAYNYDSRECLKRYLLKIPKLPKSRAIYPFILEHIALLDKPRVTALRLATIPDEFIRVGLNNHAIRCLCNCYQLIHNSGWDYIKQSVFLKIYSFTRISPVSLFNSRRFYFQKAIQRCIKASDQFTVVNPKFIELISCCYVVEGFPETKPQQYNDSWFEIAERLFGSLCMGKFFQIQTSNTIQCSKMEPVLVEVKIRNNEPFPLDNSTIKSNRAIKQTNNDILFSISSNASYIVDHMSMSLFSNKIQLSLPRTAINVSDEIPYVAISSRTTEFSLFRGETAEFSVTLKNMGMDLTHLSMIPTKNIRVVTSGLKEIVGNYKLPNLKSGESFTVKMAVDGLRDGDGWVFFGYWGSTNNPRYQYHQVKFTVKELDQINGFRNFHTVGLEVRDMIPLGVSCEGIDLSQHFFHRDNTVYVSFVDYPEDSTRFTIDLPSRTNEIAFWFKTKNGVMSIPRRIPPFPLLIEITENKITMTNITSAVIDGVHVSIVNCIATGKVAWVINHLSPGEHTVLRFKVLVQDSDSAIRITCGKFSLSRGLYHLNHDCSTTTASITQCSDS